MSKQDNYALADYVLSGDSERQALISVLLSSCPSNRKHCRAIARDHIYHKAFKVLYGAKDAEKNLTEILNEVKDY